MRRLRPVKIPLAGNHVAFRPAGDIDFSFGVILRAAESTPAARELMVVVSLTSMSWLVGLGVFR
jgi:hypothetical protein